MHSLISSAFIIGLICLVSAPGRAADDILGPDTKACAHTSSGPSVLVRVHGFKDRAGNVRVELYPATPEDFLASRRKLEEEGKVFKRIDVPTPTDGDAHICVELPDFGSYALSVLHDRNASGKLDPFSDGFGFPNNPKLGMSKPDVEEATFIVFGKMNLDIVLNYWSGFSAKPLNNP
tara:strand:- start:1488 stop:2018 length:531 start_codon:yes stop_codon:yes gene_type:complete